MLNFIARYYGPEMSALVALCMALIMLLLAGACLCAMAQVVATFLGRSFLKGVLIAVPVMLFYTWTGGFRATVYTDVVHFAAVLVAVAPLLFLVVREFGGVQHLRAAVAPEHAHLWQTLPLFAPQATMGRSGLILGLGIVLIFGYWSTDFVVLHKA